MLAALAFSDLCDDLRTRSGASGFPRGVRVGTAEERSEGGADDRRLNNGSKLACLWGKEGGRSLAAAQPHQKSTRSA